MFDICIIGSGPGGYTAALHAASNNLKACLIEKNQIGGVCLNCGCIPTKSLLYSAKIYSLCKDASKYGIDVKDPTINFQSIILRKNNIVGNLRNQLLTFLKFKKIEIIQGEAQVLSTQKVKVQDKTIETKNIIIASGSQTKTIPNFEFDKKKIISSDEILELGEVPKSLLIIGAGAIGCEFANIFAAFETRVTLVEMLDEILPSVEREIAAKLRKSLEKKGISVFTKKDAKEFNPDDFDKILISVGRSPNIDIKDLSNLGVKLERRISVDDHLRTNVKNIYAIGDCNGLSLLAHSASHQARIAVDNILGKNYSFDNSLIPNCIYTEPQVAYIGLNEEQLKLEGRKYFVKKFLFNALGKAHIICETEGFLKLIIEKESERILGAAVIGPEATEIIASLTLAITQKLTLAQLKEVVYAHPTLSEIVSEASHF